METLEDKLNIGENISKCGALHDSLNMLALQFEYFNNYSIKTEKLYFDSKDFYIKKYEISHELFSKNMSLIRTCLTKEQVTDYKMRYKIEYD